ncbi:MAG: NFACT RNA binding domain-containing protein [Thermodesulfobacteriota bacterium]
MKDRHQEERTAPEAKVWRYALSGGWQVIAGRSDRDNELVTFRLARPADLWFHVRGFAGSHVLLQGPAGEEPSREAVRQAAAVAAYHSKAREAGRVPVACTMARHVSKPPGAKPGTVQIRKEKIVMVRPELPEEETPGG